MGPRLPVWAVYEQVFIAALDLRDREKAKVCLDALRQRFPGSARVRRLVGMSLEADGQYAAAGVEYDAVLQELPANTLVQKRKVR